MKFKKNPETNDNKSINSQNPWDATKAVLRRNFTAMQSHLKEQEKNLKQPKLTLEATRERTKPSQQKEIIKIRTKIIEIETKKKIAKNNETKSQDL